MEKNNNPQSDPESEALGLFASRPSILETFLDLTESGSLDIKWNPLEDPVQWETDVKPSDTDLKQISALRLFNEKGFFDGVIDEGTAKFRVIASEWAMEVRKAYNHLPQTLKEKIKEELRAI